MTDSSPDVPSSGDSKQGFEGFSLEDLRLSQNFADQIGVKKALLTVPVRKPNRQWFIRVHADQDHRFQTGLLEFQEERESYLVAPPLWAELPGDLIPKVLLTAINRQGVVFLWPIRLPGADGRHDEWNRSALEAAQMAEKGWIKVVANMSLSAYEVYEATGDIPDPEWPEHDIEALIRIAFKDRLITSMDHPVIRKLQGGV
jgi:hypothetical protein